MNIELIKKSPNHLLKIIIFFLISWPTIIIAADAPATATNSAAPLHENTNVILISLQCLRPDHLSIYGYKRQTSRNIDDLARNSVLFENAISQANLTPVAQMSVLTSQYPRVNGMVSFEVSQDMVTQRTLPEIMKLYGYNTAAIVSSPEFFLRYDGESGVKINPGDVFSRSFDYFGRTRKGPGGRSVRKLPTEAFQWLGKNKDKKFFLWIASGLIHMPFGTTVPMPIRAMYDPPDYTPFWKRLPEIPVLQEAGDAPDYALFSRVRGLNFYWGFKPVYKLNQVDVDYVNARYDAGVYYTDLFIGKLMQLLDSLEISDKTMVILQSIHGEDLGENGNFFHYDVSETVVKNALLVHFPGKEFAGQRIADQVQGIDIMPSILDYLSIPLPHETQGHSFLPLIKDEPGAFRNTYAYIDRLPWWEYTLEKWYLSFKRSQGAAFAPEEMEKLPAYQELLHQSFEKIGYPPGDIAIRTNDWKLIYRKNLSIQEKVSWWNFLAGQPSTIPAIELYDLRNDPGETVNVAEANPEKVSELKDKLLAWDKIMEEQKAAFREDDKRLIIPYP